MINDGIGLIGKGAVYIICLSVILIIVAFGLGGFIGLGIYWYSFNKKNELTALFVFGCFEIVYLFLMLFVSNHYGW